MPEVLLSVCIPVYNCEPYIGEAIDSVLSQSFRDFELVIVDNCSTDNTVAVIRKYNDPRIRLVQNASNIGLLGNWNKAVELCRGKYVKMLPADDFIYPGCLQKQVEVFEKDREKKIAVVSGRKNIITDTGKVLFNRGLAKKDVRMTGRAAINRVIRAGGNVLGEPGSVMFRRETFEKTGAFDASCYYVIDLNMWLRMLRLGDLYFLGDVVCAFRVSAVSESIRQINTQRRDVDAFFNKLYKDGSYGITALSYRIGIINSYITSVAKKIFYKIYM